MNEERFIKALLAEEVSFINLLNCRHGNITLLTRYTIGHDNLYYYEYRCKHSTFVLVDQYIFEPGYSYGIDVVWNDRTPTLKYVITIYE